MATGQWPNLNDVLSRMDGAGKQIELAEMLSQSNDIWDDIPMVEANGVGGHEFAFRTSIPAGAWRQYNMGVPYAKSTSAKARVGLGTLEDYSQIDRMLAEDSGDIAGFRESEDIAFLQGMSQTMVQTLFYGNTAVTPAEFMGLAPFYNTVNPTNAQNAQNVINGGGTGSSNCSIWLIGWSKRTIFGVYPKGTKAGLAMEDKGDMTPGFDALGNRFEAYTSWFRQQFGLVPQDWRYGVRIANIDTTNAGLAGPNALDIFATLSAAVLALPTLAQASGIRKTDSPREPTGVQAAIYCNRTARHWMDIQGMRDRNVLLSIQDYAGKPIEVFRTIPIRIVDQLVNTEATVS